MGSTPGGHHHHDHPDDGHHHHPIEVDFSRDLTWEQETVELSTVGIDIGSATTHVTFARVYLQRVGQLMTDRFSVVRRDVVWQSPVRLTPYVGEDRIDSQAVRDLVETAYAGAGLSPADVDTGAVLLTGVALLRDNAETLTRELAAFAGDFVCAAASHHMEAVLAAHGSGAVEESRRNGGGVLSLDIGGGTAKFSWIREGEIERTAALGVGGRLVAWSPDLVVERVEGYASELAEAIGLPLKVGATLDAEDRSRLCAEMATVLADAVTGAAAGREQLVLTDWPEDRPTVDRVVLSGGVAEYLRSPETPRVEDLGYDLSVELGRALDERGVTWSVAPAAIRATVLGAAGYSVDISGNTVFLSDPEVLPLRDVPVVTATVHVDADVAALEGEIGRAVDRYHGLPGRPLCLYLALAGDWRTYDDIHRLAMATSTVWRARHRDFAGPLVLVMQADLARSLGRMLVAECDLATELVCLDGIALAAFDFVDVGAARRAVHPVVVKSLVFGDAS